MPKVVFIGDSEYDKISTKMLRLGLNIRVRVRVITQIITHYN